MAKSGGAVVREFLQCFLKDDIDGALSLLTDDFVLHECDSVPYGGDHVGKDAFLAMRKTFREVWEAHSDTDDDHVYIDGGNGIVACVATTPLTARASGQRFHMRAAEIFTIRDEKIADLEVFYWDTKQIFDATTGAASAQS
jgi:uncharacterized protein